MPTVDITAEEVFLMGRLLGTGVAQLEDQLSIDRSHTLTDTALGVLHDSRNVAARLIAKIDDLVSECPCSQFGGLTVTLRYR